MNYSYVDEDLFFDERQQKLIQETEKNNKEFLHFCDSKINNSITEEHTFELNNRNDHMILIEEHRDMIEQNNNIYEEN